MAPTGHRWKRRPETILAGERNPNWHGGRKTHKRGYILVRAPFGHPRTNMDGYILEHILVMEQYLGRFLTPQEVVHHKNHITNDNRIENLELFASHADHLSMHMKKDMSGRFCSNCGSKDTRLRKGKYFDWYSDGKGGHRCHRCAAKFRGKTKKERRKVP